jgi:hypothetical protein
MQQPLAHSLLVAQFAWQLLSSLRHVSPIGACVASFWQHWLVAVQLWPGVWQTGGAQSAAVAHTP